jgi:peptidoglycan hydrolase-like protein with peptidoglycan-binding domain
LGQAIDPLPTAPPSDWAVLAKGAKGDLVVWAQQHLKGAGQALAVDGDFGSGTQAAVKSFQTGAGLAATGKIDTATWQALLQHAPAKAKWTPRSQPRTAKLPARRYEIRPGRGARSGSGWRATG